MDNKTTKGLILKSIENISMQVISFILQLILARLLLPEDFGIIAILNTFINLANTFVNNGLTSALLQKKEIKQVDISTVFYIDFVMSLLMYAIIYILSPFIASFYDNNAITTYLRVFSLSIPIGALASIQLTVSRYHLNFMPSLIASLSGVFAQTVVGIYMALNGGGLWSLILSQLSYFVVRAILLIILVHWKPSFMFSISSFKNLFSYSWKLFMGWMIGTLYQDVFAWIIGKKFSSQTLGYYSKGNSIPSIVNRLVTQVTTSVMFPSLAKSQDDIELIKKQTRQMITVSSAIIFPVMGGLSGISESFVTIVLTEKWLPCVPVIQILSISLALNVINNANMQTFNALGRSDLFLKFEMIKRSISVILVFVFANIDYYLMLWGIVIVAVISIIINALFNKKILKYAYKEYLADILPYIFFGILLFIILNSFHIINIHLFIKFLLQSLLCAIFFLILVFSGILPGYKLICEMLLGLLKKKRQCKD